MVVSSNLASQIYRGMELEYSLPFSVKLARERGLPYGLIAVKILVTIIPILSLIIGICCLKTGITRMLEGLPPETNSQARMIKKLIEGCFLVLGLGLLLIVFMTLLSLGKQLFGVKPLFTDNSSLSV